MQGTINTEWKTWIQTNVDNGCDKNGIFKILLDEGYAYDHIVKEMGYLPTVEIEELINPLSSSNEGAISTTTYGAPIKPNKIFIPNAKKLETDNKLDIYILKKFLNKEECDYIVKLIRSELKPSSLSSYEKDKTYRTSSTCALSNLKDVKIQDIDYRICKIIGIDSSYSEPIQGQYYNVGEEFKAHTDYFEKYEMQSHGKGLGQRTYTCMIYLNNVEEGGETHFSHIDSTFKPTEGMAVIWSNLNQDGTPNINSMHHAMPVVKGYKAVITKWFRSNNGLETNTSPMFTKKGNEYIKNYTEKGFLKTTLSDDLFQKISLFYKSAQHNMKEEYVEGNFIHGKKNPSSLVDLPQNLRNEIHDKMKSKLEEWCEKKLKPTYVYGIRVYHNQAILESHYDRLETHIISVIINVDQKVNEDWFLSIEDNYCRKHNVILKPGEVVFYEGARLNHGRTIPLNGEFFANVFCHFVPEDYIPRKLG